MRLHKLARTLNVPPSALLDALRRAGLGARFGSPMTHVLDEDLPEVFRVCEQHLPGVSLSSDQLGLAQGFEVEKGYVKARARDATMEARLPQALPEPVHPPLDVSWSTFLDEVGVVTGGGSLRTTIRLGYDSGEGQVRLLAESVAHRRVMARRRQALNTLYDTYGALEQPVLLDLFLFEVPKSLRAALHNAQEPLVLALQSHLEHMFPPDVDRGELVADLNPPHITAGLTCDEALARLRFEVNLAELLASYSDAPLDAEAVHELEQMIRGDEPMNYRTLKKMSHNEQLSMRSALPHELLRSDDTLVAMARAHLGGEDDLTLIDLCGSAESSRHAFFIVASSQHAIGYVTARAL